MADRIAQYSEYDPVQLQDAPITTFHSYCYRLLRRYGYDTPSKLGIDDQLPDSLELIEDSIREQVLFGGFISRFEDAHPEYEEFFATMNNPKSLSALITKLASKGVIPQRDGWYRETGAVLHGDRAEFFEDFEQHNEPNEGVNGLNQSDARGSLSGWDDDQYIPSAPSSESFLKDLKIDPKTVEKAFDEDCSKLLEFVHDVYFEYLQYAIDRNYLTQSLMLTMAFVMLCEDETIRQQVAHRYVMVDEFQDTNELQFKLSLLLAAENNICVVGDWKQSIYGFQYTEVENIQSFEDRLTQFKTELNTDRQRISYTVSDVTTIPLKKNYRSTASILSHARETLTVPATRGEQIDPDTVGIEEALEATNYVDNSQIHAYSHADETELILDRIEHVVGNPDYAVETTDEPAETPEMSGAEAETAERQRLGDPSYSDIAVFTRTRSFARELLETAQEYGIPVAYEGGVALFDTDQAKLLLAWLRIVETDADRGWATVLEEAGYTLPVAKQMLDTGEFPPEIVAFRDELADYDTIGGFARHVLNAYGYTGGYADGLVSELTGMYETTLATRSEAIAFIEENLEAETTIEIDANPGENSVTLQTIHSAKGLEYPIVILGNMNYRAFPHFGRPSSGTVQYSDRIGLRQRKQYSSASGHPYVYSHWPYDLLTGCLPSEYNEERRLFYVAVTRAKRHLLLTAGDNPSSFFDEFPLDAEQIDPDIEPRSAPDHGTDDFAITPLAEQNRPHRLSVHEIMDDSVYDDVEDGRGTAFGNQVHDFAEAYADGDSVVSQSEDEENIIDLLDSLTGAFRTEITAILPFEGSPQITLVGIVDLLVEKDDAVEIIDYKTDLSRHAEPEYRKQLSVYYHVASEWYPDKDITASVYYTATGEQGHIEPLDLSTLHELAIEHL